MKDTTEKDTEASGEHEAARTSSAPLLKKTKSFGWLQAAIIAVPLALVGIFIVLSTFAATVSPNTKQVQDIYFNLLHRRPVATDSGVQYWAKKMDAGTSKTAIESAIKSTSEYKSKNPSTPIVTGAKSGSTGGSSGTTNLNAEIAWVNQQCATLELNCNATVVKARAQSIVALKKTRAQVLKDLQNAKATISKTKNVKATTQKQSLSACEADLLKGYILTGPNRNFFGGSGSYASAKVAAIEDSADDFVRASYRKYLGKAHPYSSDTSGGWELTNEMVADSRALSSCQTSKAAFISKLQNSAAGRAWAARYSDIVTNVENPIKSAFAALDIPTRNLLGGPEAWIMKVVSGKVSVGEALSQISSGTVACTELPEGTTGILATVCEDGVIDVTENAQLQSANNALMSPKPSNSTSTPSLRAASGSSGFGASSGGMSNTR